MIIDISAADVAVREAEDLTRLHVRSTNPDPASDARLLAGAGLGVIDGDGAALLDVARLYRMVREVPGALDPGPGWGAMLTYAERHGWTDPDRRHLRAHVVRGAREEEAAVPPQLFREVLGHFASGVAVVTSSGAAGPVGFSCQSFSSLSLDPPLVLVLPGRGSTSWPLIEATGAFCVNVLAADQQELCNQFARSGADKFAGVDWEPGELGLPRLAGACAWIECDIVSVESGGDHWVVQGLVRTLETGTAASPLVFHRGSYAELADRAAG